MNFAEHEKNGAVWLTAPVITARHAFTTRLGGVSAGPFAAMNLAFGRGDPAENVLQNYRLLGAALGLDPFSAAFTKQVHGAHVRVVTDADRAGPGDPAPEAADGLVTAVPGLPLFVFTADCVPVLLHDPVHGVAAAVHCGWRSSVADILGAAVSEMRALGAEPGHLCAAVGPAIGPCCFETGPEVPEAVRAWLGAEGEAFITPGRLPDKSMIDLPGANRRRLLQLGLFAEHIAVSGVCTRCCPEKFWSHRGARGGPRGSQAAVIVL